MVEDLRCRRRSLKEFPRRRHAGSTRFQPIVKPVDAPRAALVAVDEARRGRERKAGVRDPSGSGHDRSSSGHVVDDVQISTLDSGSKNAEQLKHQRRAPGVSA